MKRAGQGFDPAVIHVASTVTRESGSDLPLMILALLQDTPGSRGAHIRLAGYRATVYPQSLHKNDDAIDQLLVLVLSLCAPCVEYFLPDQ